MTRAGRGVRRGRRRWARWLTGLAAVVAAAAAVAGCAGSAPPAGAPAPAGQHRCTVTATLVPTCGAWWGMYLDTDPGGTGLATAVAAEQQRLGRPLDIIERYHDMSHGGNGIFPNPAETALASSHLLLYSWSPAIWSRHTYYRWSTIASGALDASVIVPEAQRLRALGHRVFLTFGAEPDGAVPSAGTPAQFVAAWRHVHDVFARQGATNVVWVWTTTGYVPHAATIAALYPGDAYVDWIGYDPYNFYTCHHNRWQSFAETVRPFYDWLAQHHLGDGKPLMLPEFGSAPDPADPARDAAWYASIVPVLRDLPRLKALVLWNSSTPGCDLRLSQDSVASRGYRQAGLSPYLRQDLP